MCVSHWWFLIISVQKTTNEISHVWHESNSEKEVLPFFLFILLFISFSLMQYMKVRHTFINIHVESKLHICFNLISQSLLFETIFFDFFFFFSMWSKLNFQGVELNFSILLLIRFYWICYFSKLNYWKIAHMRLSIILFWNNWNKTNKKKHWEHLFTYFN